MKYRKKPIVIDAMQFLGNINLQECLNFIGSDCGGDDSRIVIGTLEGDMTCQKLDWIIKGVKGEFYPCKPDIFEATYEMVKEEAPEGICNLCGKALERDRYKAALEKIILGRFHIGNDKDGNVFGPPDGVMYRNIAQTALAPETK